MPRKNRPIAAAMKERYEICQSVCFSFVWLFSFTCLLFIAGPVQAAEDFTEPYQGGDGLVHWHSETVAPGEYSFEVDNVPDNWLYPAGTTYNAKWYRDDSFIDRTYHPYDDPDYSFYFSSGTIYIEASIHADDTWKESHIWVVTVVEPPELERSPSSLDFGSSSTNRTFQVRNSGGGTLSYSISDNRNSPNWLWTSPTSGNSTGEWDTINVYVSRSGLSPGNYSGTITIDPNVGSDQTVSVSMSIADPDPTASRVTPGSPITLDYGTNQGFTVRGEDAGGDLWKVEWTLSGPESHSDTDVVGFGGSSDTADFTDFGGYTFDVAGDYTLIATVYDDSGDTDSVSWSIHVNEPPKPDLEVTSIEINDNTASGQHFSPGESVRLDFQGHNRGQATSITSVRMKWWYGTSPYAKTYEIYYGYLGTINGLAPDEYEWETDASWPMPTTPGTYWLTVKIDDNNQQSDEEREDNNERTLSFIIDEPPKPDLIVEDIKMEGETNLSTLTIYTGDSVTIDALSKNVGKAGSKPSVPYKWWWGYSSEDKHQEITDGNGNDVGGTIAGVNGLGINEEQWVSEVGGVPGVDPDNWVVNLNAGTYWLTFEIDNPNQNDEGSNEGNNTHSESFVVLSDPDPTASRVTPGSPITLDYGTNQGFTVRGEDAGGDLWKVEWTLSGPESHSDTDVVGFGGSSDTADFTDVGGYTFDVAGDYTLIATVYDDSGDTDSVSWSIHVNEEQPQPPTLISPLDGAVLDNNCDDYSDSIEWDFNWSDVQGATKYQIYVIRDGATSPYIDTIVTSSSYHYSSSSSYIAQDDRFNWTWKVKAGNDSNTWSEWSEERHFDVEPLNKDCVFGESWPDRRFNIIYPGIADRNNITWFIHISDAHIGNGLDEVPRLEAITETAYDVIEPDFIVNTGDLVESEGTWELPPFTAPGELCCDWQDAGEWNEYYNIVNIPEFRENYYDLPGNHDRYGDPEWDGETGNDGYANKSIRGPSSDPIGQFMWAEGENYFIGVNTCDEIGAGYFYYLVVSDLPVLSDDELDDLEVNLIKAHRDPNGNLVFAFGHHSIFTRPDKSFVPGLYDDRYDKEDLNARGAEDFINLLNTYEVSTYGFGHTHMPEIFIQQDVPFGFDGISALQVNPGALGDHGEYAIVAIDNGGVAVTTATVNDWPVVLITAPVDMHLGGDNPYCYPLPKHEGSNNKVRAIVFNPDDLTEGNPTNDSDGDVQFCTTQAFGEWKDMKNVDDHIWEADLDVANFATDHEYQVWVRAWDRNTDSIDIDLVSFKVADPIATSVLDPVHPGDDCTITVTGFGEGTYFRLAWDGQSLFATEKIVNGSASITFPIPPNAEANADAGSHYVRAFDEAGNYIVYFITVLGDSTPPDPNPMTWVTEPYAASSTSISMVATTAIDSESPPVSYFFNFVNSPTGGTGGSDSIWQSDTSYTDTGLQPNHQYGYQVKARDSSTPNETNPSTPVVYEYTLANTPEASSFSDVTEISIQANWSSNGNPSGTEYLCENTTNGSDSGWITKSYWDCTGLNCGTSYSFRVKARNGDGVETDWTNLGSQSTQGCSGDTTPPDTSIAEGPSGTITYNNITFTYTGSDNVTATANLVYSYKLDGYDSSWSAYTSATSKSYNDLPNSAYTFNVKSRDQAGNVDPTPASRSFVVNVCTYSISPTEASFSCTGGSDTVSIEAPTGCEWEAISNDPAWIEITFGSSGSGNGTVNYSVSANESTSPRTGTMTIAGKTFTVNQGGVGISASFPFTEDFESGDLADYWSSNSSGEGQIQVTSNYGPYGGNYHLTMDDSLGNSTYSLNELVLNIDLSDKSGVMLSFWHKEFFDEDDVMPVSFTGNHNSDGVAISADGNTWYKVQGLTSSDGVCSTYEKFVVDLDAAIASAGINYNSSFKIKFQQYDNYPINEDGFAFDDIEIYRAAGINPVPWLMLLLSDNDNPTFDILYQSDFLSDPGWITNNPVSYYWDSDTQSFYGLQHRKAVENAYHHIDWDNNTPLKVQVDLMQASGSYAYWVNFCIMDSSMILPCGPSLGENIIHIGTGHDDLGKHFILTSRESDGTAHSDRVNTSFEYGKYYRWDIQYLPDSSEVTATVRDIGDGTIMAELNIPAPTGFTGIDRIGFSTNIPGSSYDSTAPSYIDNLTVWGTSSD